MVRFLMLTDEVADDDICDRDDVVASELSSAAKAALRLERFTSIWLSMFANSWSKSRSMLRRLFNVSSKVDVKSDSEAPT